MKKLTTAAAFLLVLGISAAMPLKSANAIELPAPNCGLTATSNCLNFDDFDVYSLALLSFLNGDGKPNGNEAFNVKSGPGQLKDDIVIFTQAAGAADNQDLGLGANGLDDAYNSPNSVPGGSSFTNFLMYDDPTHSVGGNPDFATDNIRNPFLTVNNNSTAVDGKPDGVANAEMQGWDITRSALASFLAGDALAFFFNLNEENAADELDDGQDMLAYADVYLTLAGVVVQKLTFSGNLCGGFACVPGLQSLDQTADVDDILPEADDKWAYVHGQICVATGPIPPAGTVLLGSCGSQNAGAGIPGTTVNQNLGQNSAAFALFNRNLSDAILDNGIFGDWDTMTVDGRMARLDDGFEQLFIRRFNIGECDPRTETCDPQIPEPGTLSIFGLGLIGLGILRRRKKAA